MYTTAPACITTPAGVDITALAILRPTDRPTDRPTIGRRHHIGPRLPADPLGEDLQAVVDHREADHRAAVAVPGLHPCLREDSL